MSAPNVTLLQIRKPPRTAGGWGAMLWTARHALKHLGPLRATRILLRINQIDGFDCPGCAWPESQHRSVAEFCENGAKAVAEEATTARITESFLLNTASLTCCNNPIIGSVSKGV